MSLVWGRIEYIGKRSWNEGLRDKGKFGYVYSEVVVVGKLVLELGWFFGIGVRGFFVGMVMFELDFINLDCL